MNPTSMETMPPFPVVSGQRQLAAIMFTDAVGYSAKMHEQEIATLNRIERDSATMRRMIEANAGTVMKSTGDGLLVQFASAVQAVGCALEIQRHFASREDAGVTSGALRHRVGIHLGDIFVGNGDIMGDGVNIAARLVTTATPGGIVISQTVYDVVKNKMSLHAMRVGPQQLKNIKEPVTIYRLLLDEPTSAVPAPVARPVVAAAAPAGTPAAPVPATEAPARFRWQRLAWFVGLALVAALGARYLLQRHRAHEEDLGRSQTAQAALGELLKKSATDPAAAPVAAPANPAPARNFAALVSRQPAKDRVTAETLPTIREAETAVGTLMTWLGSAMTRYTKDRPLQIRALQIPGAQNAMVYLQGGQLHFAAGGASRQQVWEELKEPMQASLIVSALRDAPVKPSADVWEGGQAFAYLHGYPEMSAVLQQGQSPTGP